VSGPLSIVDNFFIVVDTYLLNIYQVDATSGVTGQLLPLGFANYPTVVTYDPTDKLIYWADFIAHTINRYSLLTNTSTMIYRDPNNTGKYIKTTTFTLQVRTSYSNTMKESRSVVTGELTKFVRRRSNCILGNTKLNWSRHISTLCLKKRPNFEKV